MENKTPIQTERKGQTLVEFALTLPLLLLLMFGIVEFGRLFQSWVSLQNSARVAVRYASTGSYDPWFDDYISFDPFDDSDSVVPCVAGAGRGSAFNYVPPGDDGDDNVQIYENLSAVNNERLFATWYSGLDCDPENPFHQFLRRDLLRIVSIYHQARISASSLAIQDRAGVSGALVDVRDTTTDRVTGSTASDIGITTEEQLRQFLFAVWHPEYPGYEGTPAVPEAGSDELRGYFDVVICSSRGMLNPDDTDPDTPDLPDSTPRYPDAPNGSTSRFITVTDNDPAVYGAAARLAPGCVLNEVAPYPYNVVTPDRRWLDAGGPGDRVTVIINYHHPLITPLGLANYVPIQARRTAVVESFRASNAVGAVVSGVPVLLPNSNDEDFGAEGDDPDKDDPFVPVAPPPGADPTEEPTEQVLPFDCSLFSKTIQPNPVPADVFAPVGSTLQLTIRNGNTTDNVVVDRAVLEWGNQSTVWDIYVHELQVNGAAVWSGQDDTPNTDSTVDPGNTASLGIAGYDAYSTFSAEFRNAPDNLNEVMSLRDLDQTTLVVRDTVSGESCDIVWDFSGAPDTLLDDDIPDGPVDCEVENLQVRADDPFFHNDKVRFIVANNGTTPVSMVDFSVNWRAHQNRDHNVDLKMQGVSIGGTSATSPDSTQLWIANPSTGVSLQQNGGTYAHPYDPAPATLPDYDSITKADGTWQVGENGYVIEEGRAFNVWIDYNLEDLGGNGVGLIKSDFNTTNFTFIVTACADGGVDGNGNPPQGNIDFNIATPPPTIDVSQFRPNARNDNYEMFEDEVLTVNVANGPLANDEDSDGGNNIEIVWHDNTIRCDDSNLSWNNDGSFTYDPRNDDCLTNMGDGEEQTVEIRYRIRQNDEYQQQDEARVYITVKGKGQSNDPPNAQNQSASTDENSPISSNNGNRMTNGASDPDGDPFYVRYGRSPTGDTDWIGGSGDGKQTVSDQWGTFSFWPDGDWEYDPTTGSAWDDYNNGDEHTVEYRFRLIDDPNRGGVSAETSAERRVRITVSGVGSNNNDPGGGGTDYGSGTGGGSNDGGG